MFIMLMKIKYLFIILLLSALHLFFGCADNPASFTNSTDYAITYSVTIPSMNRDSIFVTLRINAWQNGDSVHLLAPPVYADNPFLAQTGINFCNLSVTDTNNQPVAYVKDSLAVGPFKNLTLSFPKSACPVIISYTPKLHYEPPSVQPAMPVPNIGEQTGYLEGNYIFMIPVTNKHVPDLWRDQFRLLVSFSLGAGIRLYGSPLSNAEFHNPYELLFFQAGLLSGAAPGKQILFEGEAAGQAFRCVNVATEKTFSDSLTERAKNTFIAIISDVSPKFGTIDESPVVMLTGFNKNLGLEGMYAFCVFDFLENDTLGWLGMTAAHEFLHCWLGVRTGEYDMAWWKEGTTYYAGFVVAKRNNLCTQKLFEQQIVAYDLSSTTGLFLADEDLIRHDLFLDGTVAALVYMKGAQVTMILDRMIREATHNAVNIIDILAALTKDKNGSAFYKNYYLSTIQRLAGVDVSAVLTRYENSKDVIPDTTLWNAFNAIGTMGGLGDFIPHGK